MASNPVTCGNCGTENPPDREFCLECQQPLTASAEEGIRENLAAQDRGGFIGAGGTAGTGIIGAGGIGGAPLLSPDGMTNQPANPRERST